MKLIDILSEEARSTGRDLRLERYLDEACAFLDFAYDDDALLQPRKIRRDFARACYERSHCLGTSMIGEHLGYLSVSVLCGYAFEANPLYQHELDRAGWIDERWQTRRAPDPSAMTDFANRWHDLAQLECATPSVMLLACHEALDQMPALPHPAEAATLAIPRDLHLTMLHNAWPDRTAIMPQRTLEWFCDLLNRNIVQQQMPADVAVMFSILSLHLGIFFFHDPRYRDLSDAFAQNSATADDRSAQVAAALRRLLIPSPPHHGIAHG